MRGILRRVFRLQNVLLLVIFTVFTLYLLPQLNKIHSVQRPVHNNLPGTKKYESAEGVRRQVTDAPVQLREKYTHDRRKVWSASRDDKDHKWSNPEHNRPVNNSTGAVRGNRELYKVVDLEPRQPTPIKETPHDSLQQMVQFQKQKSQHNGISQMGRLKLKQFASQPYRWTGWFEQDDKKLVKLERLNEYVTEDIAPMAIQSQLSQCTLELGVSQESLQSQHEDLEKASIKLSAFLSALKSLLPNSFSSEFASPCWLSDKINGQANVMNDISKEILEDTLNAGFFPNHAADLVQEALSGPFPKEMCCLPYFFLAGFPKSATTTMAEALIDHPRISDLVEKGTHWWTRAPILSPDANLLQLNVLRYLVNYWHLTYFATQHGRLLTMDSSQSTLWDSNFVFNGHDFCSTPAAISHVLPKAKFIIMMREPSERLYSYYLWSCSFKYGNNTEKWPSKVRDDPAGNFHSEVSQAVSDFKLCLQSHSLYECSNFHTFINRKKVTQYCGQIGFRLVVSIYYIHIAKFLQFFPQEQFLFLKMKDISQEPVTLMNRVTRFLEIAPYPPSKIRDLLERKRNRQRATIQPMHEDTKQLLQDFFRPFNRQLADLLNDTRFLWNYS